MTFNLFSGVQRGTSGLVDGWHRLWSGYVALRGLHAENEALKQRLSELEVRLQQERAIAQRSQKLQQLLDLKSQTALPTLAADVIAGDATPGIPGIWIDKRKRGCPGRHGGHRTGGRSSAASSGRSRRTPRVQLIIGPNAGAGAMIERSRAGGVVGTAGDPPLLMEYVSNLSDVQVGDIVVTAGNDGIYPNFPIGRVETAERGTGLYKTIKVRPVVDFSNVEEVLVVLSPLAAVADGRGQAAMKTAIVFGTIAGRARVADDARALHGRQPG